MATTTLYNINQNKKLRQNLRKQDIVSEKILWHKLRNNKQGVKFRRQHGIGNFIVDFCCVQLKLVIEIDGATHGSENEVIYDKKRQEYLERLGFIVKRYSNTDVKENLSDLIFDLQKTIFELGKNKGIKLLSPD